MGPRVILGGRGRDEKDVAPVLEPPGAFHPEVGGHGRFPGPGRAGDDDHLLPLFREAVHHREDLGEAEVLVVKEDEGVADGPVPHGGEGLRHLAEYVAVLHVVAEDEAVGEAVIGSPEPAGDEARERLRGGGRRVVDGVFGAEGGVRAGRIGTQVHVLGEVHQAAAAGR